MASVDCRLISPQSPFQVLFVEPVQEGFYSIYHGVKDYYALYEKCVAKGRFPELTEFYWGTVRILTGLSLWAFPFNAIIFQIFVSVAGSYREGLRDAVDKGETEIVEFYLNLGVTPDNIYDTKALIFRTKKRDIIEALINAGADLSRTYSGMTFLEHLINEGMEDLAEAHLDRLSVKESMYANAILEKNWPVAAFLVRMGRASLLEREKIQVVPKTTNPLEMLVIKGDARGLASCSQDHELPQMKQWVDQLQISYPRMKMDWIWTAILSVYCESQGEVPDETIYKLFEYGVLHGEENPLGFKKSDFIYWAGMHRRETLVDLLVKERLLTVDSSDFEELLKDSRDRRTFFDFAIRLGYRGTPEEVRDNPYQCKSENPLEGIVATQNNARLETFVESRSFEECYEVYLDLKTHFPNMYTGWMWNVIYEIPQSHFDQFTPVQTSATITSAPPRCYPLSDLLAVFDQINFNDPRKGHFIEEKALSETLDSTPTYRTPSDIRKGLGNIIEALQTGRKVYKLLPEEVEGYRLQIQWIIHLLKAGLKSGPLPRHKANVLIDMGKACLMCPGRYNDIFDIAIKRLKNEEVAVVSFEDQLQRYFADLRSKILNRVAFKIAKGCVHSWENLVYHLHDERALQEPKPHRFMSSQQFHQGEPTEDYYFVFKSDAEDAFDAEYTPDELMGVLSEFARVDRKRSEQENDFNELMMDAMVEAYSTQFPAIQDLEHRMKVRVPQGILFEDQVLPLEEVEAIFKPINPHYRISRTEENVAWTVSKHFSDFKRGFLAYTIRPFTEDMMRYALPEVIHPIVMGKVLCDLGHLRQRITFREVV